MIFKELFCVTAMRQVARATFFSLLTGVVAGASVALFLLLLEWVTALRHQNPVLLYFLPLAGLVISIFYEHFDRGVRQGSALVLDRIHTLGEVIPFRMSPFVLISTILTHLCGGSAGREGTAVQLGASLADQLSFWARLSPKERKRILIAGTGAGFAAAFGTPFAGILFGLEVVNIGKFEYAAIGETVVASFAAFLVVQLLGIHHLVYPGPEFAALSTRVLFGLVLAGIAFGLAAEFFVRFTHLLERLWKKMFFSVHIKALCVGTLLVIFFKLEASGRFLGLGFEEIFRSFQIRESFSVPTLKLLFTSLTLSGGFKGGEFIPLVFIGSTLGSFLAPLLHLPISYLAALGLAACFGACANTPITAIVLLVETFGWQILLPAIVVCYFAYYMTGEQGIYKGQRIHRRKPLSMLLDKWKR